MTIVENIFAILFAWNIIGTLPLGIIAITTDFGRKASGLEFLNPKYIYNNIKVNYFGCFWLFLIINLASPILTICYWFYKLCTAGRKN